jgi:RHS repeat-associated protein
VGGTANLAESYVYAANSNQLLAVANGPTTRQLSYIATGNLAANDNGAGTVVSFGYDQANRLVQVANQSQSLGFYLYNFLGQRVVKSTAGSVTHFHYDRGGHLIAESDGSGNVLREHLWLGDMPVGLAAGGALYFVHPDHLGTPQRITDAGQSVVWDIALAPFGGVAQLTPSLIDNLRFPGQYADAEAGLSYNFFRDYDPSIGRYVESDPIGLGGGINTYAYVDGNPISNTDPAGLCPVCLIPFIPELVEGGVAAFEVWTGITVSAEATAAATSVAIAGATIVNAMPAGLSPAEQSQYKAEHDAYRKICSEPPPKDLCPADLIKWKLNKARACKQARQDFTDKWHDGQFDAGHKIQMDQLEKTIKKLE